MERTTGRVVAVSPEQLGVTVTATAPVAAVTVAVDDVTALIGAAGYLSASNGEQLGFLGVDVADDLGNPEQVRLAEPLARLLPIDTRLTLLSAGLPVTIWKAYVVLEDGTRPEVTVDPRVALVLSPGIREPGHRELVILERDEDNDAADWTLTGLSPGETPALDTSFASGAPINPAAVTAALDAHPAAFVNKFPPSAIAAGELNVDLRITGSIAAGDPDAGGVIHDRHGTRSMSPGGAVRSAQSVDPEQGDVLRGDAELDRLAVTGRATFTGPLEVARNGAIRLVAETVAAPPPIGPTATPTYYAVPLDLPADSIPENRRGVALKNRTEGYLAELPPPTPSASRLAAPAVLHVFNPTTGDYIGGWPFTGAPTRGEVVGIAYVASSGKLLTLEHVPAASGGRGNPHWQTRFWSFTGAALTFLSQQPWTLGGTARYPTPAFSSVPTGRQFITRSDAETGVVTILEYGVGMVNPLVTTVTDLVLEPARRDLAGAANVAGSMMIVSAATGGAIEDVDYFTGLWQATYPSAAGEASAAGYIRGVSIPGAVTSRQLSATNNKLYTYAAFHEAGKWWLGAAPRNGTTGTETVLSPLTAITRVKGSSLIVSAGDLPPGADAVNFYAVDSPTEPSPAALFRQSPVAAFAPSDPRAAILVGLRNNNTDGLHPPPLAVGTLPYSGPIPFVVTTDGSIPLDSNYSGAPIGARLTTLEAAGGGGGGGTPELGVADEIYLGSDYIEITGKV